MRVLHLITELDVGGAEKLLAMTLPRFDRARFDVTAAFLHGPAPLCEELEGAGVRVHKVDTRNKLDFAAFRRFVHYLRTERVEVLHTHLIQADILGYFAARRARVPVVISTKHNTNYFQSHARWLAALDAHVNRRLNRVVAVSTAVRAFYLEQQALPSDHVEVVPNGIDTRSFASAAPIGKALLGLGLNTRIVTCVASLKEKKGHAPLLRAWPEVLKRCPEARLVLVGDGPLRDELGRLAESLGTSLQVVFLGVRSDVASILKASDAFVLPSLWEGFGLAVVEAMSAGLPVVATSVDGVREIIRNGQDGILVPPNDPPRLAEAIVELLTNRSRAALLAQSARERAEEYSVQQMVDRLQEMYERLRAGKP